MTPDEQHTKDVQDMRYLAEHLDEILHNMRECYEGLRGRHNAFAEEYNKTIGDIERIFSGIAARLEDFDRRLQHLETGGVMDPPI